MADLPQISSSELEVMNVLWKNGGLTGTEIVSLVSKTNKWGDKTIRTFINRLAVKKAVSTERINGRAFRYYPAVDEKEYKSNAAKNFLEKMYDGSPALMLAELINDNKLSKSEINDLKKFLEDK